MKWRALMVLLMAFGICAGSAQAQSDPFGAAIDTIAIVPSVVPDPGAGQYKLKLDLYVYNDEELIGATVGFKWDNPKVVMDSAVPSPLAVSSFDFGRYVYEGFNIATTNLNRRFLFGGISMSSFMPVGADRRLWCSYYFSTPGWTTSDAVTFDTLTFNAGSEYLFVEASTNGDIYPHFAGGVTIGNPPPINQPPVLTAIGAKLGSENALLSFGVSATDPDVGDALTLSATGLPTGAGFVDHGNGTGTFTWTPTYDQANVYNVTFAVSDGEATDNEVVAITIQNVNRPPVLAAIGAKSVNENALLTFTVTASDPDGGTPTLTASNLPTGASFVPATGVFTWTPTFDQSGSYDITFGATDGIASDNELVTVTVNNVNRPPVLAAIGAKMTTVGVQLLFDVTADDPDETIPQLQASGLPAGATFVDHGDGTATFDWTPTAMQTGAYNVSFSATDGVLSDDELVAITVNPAANEAPVLAAIGAQTVDEGQTLALKVSGTDPDMTTPALTAENLPDGATFVDHGGGSADFSWTTDYADAGLHQVLFIASDGSLADSELVDITVVNINRSPMIVTNAVDTTIDECGGVNFFFVAPDPDGEATTMFAEGIVGGMVFEVIDTTATFTFVPDTTMAGVYPVTVKATDGMDTVSVLFTITVDECTIEPPCANLFLTDTLVQIVDTLGDSEGPTGFRVLEITSDLTPACFTVSDSTPWIYATPVQGCAPANLTVFYEANGLGEGVHWGSLLITGDSTVCEASRYHMVLVQLTLVDTSGFPVSDADTVTVSNANAIAGARVDLPIFFKNQCDLSEASLMLSWATEYLTLDSVTTSTGRLVDFDWTIYIANDSNFVSLYASGEGTIPSGYGEFAVLHYTVAADAPEGDYEISIYGGFASPWFVINCGNDDHEVEPWFFSGFIMVEAAPTFTCGYVVDPEGDPIDGATVEFWSAFPTAGPEAATASAADGYFEFTDYIVGQFDLYAYKAGYYPGLIENVNWGTTGIMITLTPIPELIATYEWVNFYCDANLYFGGPLPIGSVIDAYDPDGVRCGTWTVTEVGKYRFMPVYRDDPYSEEDEGAEPGDVIRFYVNGMEAQATGENVWTANGDSWQVCLEAGEFNKVCDLMAGWNLVSWSVDTESDEIAAALASIADHIELVLGFEQGGLTYDPNLPQFSTLWEVDHLSGYWIKVDADVTLDMTGAPVSAATPIPVTAGWNLVSYLPNFSLPTETALQSLGDNVLVALGFDNGGLVYLPGDEMHNTLTDMGPCFGYWVKVGANGELSYPTDAPLIYAQKPLPLGTPIAKTAAGITPTTQWMNLYAQNLTVDGRTIPAGAMVEAFTLDGVRVGSATVKANGMFGFMPVYADDPTSAAIDGVKAGESFTLAVNGVAVEETFVFSAHGDQIEVHNLTAKTGEEPVLPSSYSLRQNYPNPFNPSTTIEFSLPAAGKATIEVFNVLGELVATPFDGMAQSGANVVVWDGSNVASGIYFYRLTADNYSETKKMTLMK